MGCVHLQIAHNNAGEGSQCLLHYSPSGLSVGVA
jgi:hypothetical protein